jgi:hypothetical protein
VIRRSFPVVQLLLEGTVLAGVGPVAVQDRSIFLVVYEQTCVSGSGAASFR